MIRNTPPGNWRPILRLSALSGTISLGQATVIALFVMITSLQAQTASLVKGVAFIPYGEYSESFMPQAKLVFTGGNTRHEVVTDQEGRYEIRLPQGVYHVSGGWPGFCPINRPAVPVMANSETLINVRLFVCAIADGAEVDKNGKVVREIGFLVPTLKSETLRIDTIGGSKREAILDYATRTVRGQNTEYIGQLQEPDKIPAAFVSEVLAIYADSIVLDRRSMTLQASGHVTVENGRTRQQASAATINIRATDFLASLKLTEK